MSNFTAISLAIILFSMYLLIRNSYVHSIRTMVLFTSRWNSTKGSFIEYNRLPSYNKMIFQIFKTNYTEVLNDELYDDIDKDDIIVLCK